MGWVFIFMKFPLTLILSPEGEEAVILCMFDRRASDFGERNSLPLSLEGEGLGEGELLLTKNLLYMRDYAVDMSRLHYAWRNHSFFVMS